MATLVMDCPHCPARHSSFTLHNDAKDPLGREIYLSIATCGNCGGGILIRTASRNMIRPSETHGPLKDNRLLVVEEIVPQRQKSVAPDSVPEIVAQAFEEGCDSCNDGRYTSAVAMFRRCLELALRQFSPDIEAWKLEKRIDKLATQHLITPEMRTWAHEIRLVGNDALHADEVPTKDEALDLMRFNEMLLTYLYTLPARVDARHKEKGQA